MPTAGRRLGSAAVVLSALAACNAGGDDHATSDAGSAGGDAFAADTYAAGDAFTAGLLTQFLEGKSLRQSAVFANALAALVASKPGGTPRIDRAEVERLC